MNELSGILENIIADHTLHARWLNTLSMMENTGARKISASENKYLVTLTVLKHAAEEARHAYILKKQIDRVESQTVLEDYTFGNLLAPRESAAYLHKLDVEVCRYLKNELQLSGDDIKYAAYLLVTYAIEVRADMLYPVYQEALSKYKSRVNVKSIIAEEETHLTEMLHQMKEFFGDWEKHAKYACQCEERLFEGWLDQLKITSLA